MGNNQQKSNPPPLPLPLPSPRVEETPPAPSRSITQQYSVGSPPTAHHQNPPCHNNGGPSDACSTSSMTQVSENECVKMMMMDPATIRYTQTKFPRTFSRPSLLMKNGPNQLASTSRGVSYSMALKTIQPQLQLSWLLSQLQAGHLKVDSIPSIRVFFYNDYWYSLDNRRLWVFKQYGAPIPVTVTTSLSDFLHKFQLDGDNQSPKFIPESDIRTHSIAETKDGEKQDLIQLLFGYTIDDIMDEDLLQIKMNAIPETFNTPSEYFSSFKWPLVEEVRAQLQQALEEINEAPCIPILEVFKPERSQQSKYAEGFIQLKLCFDPNDMKLCSDPNDIPGEDEKQFQFKAKDLVLLSTNSGSSLEQLSQWSIMGFISRTPELEEVEEMEEVEERQVSESTSSPVEYHILVKRNIRAAIYEALLDNEKTWYAFYLVGLVPAYRTWQALHYSGANQEDYPIIRETLQYHPAQDLLELNAIPAKKELKDNIMSYCSFMRLNGSQAHAIATVLCDVKAERNPGVRMIQGPPGTGKTSTIVGILSVATGTGMKCLTVCPTNAAIATVALRYMGMLQSHEEKQFGEFCKSSEGIECKVLGKGDVILIGTEEKLPVKGPLKDIYLPKRVKRLKMASRGWYEAATRFSKRINPKIDCHQDEDTELETTEELVKKLKEHSNTLSLDLSGRHVEVFLTTAKLVAEFLRLEEDLRGQASAELENVLERGFGIVRRNFLSNDSIENLCLRSSSLIFCTVSTAGRMCVKQAAPFKCLIIDEAAQLVEAETAIVTTLPGLNHAILVGDQHQLPATVISKAATECAYGRSLFERMMCLGHPSHLLNKQYRMHPAISLFPSSRFYQSHLYDGDNVRSDAYKVHEKLLYGPYAFLDVNDGSEQTGDDGKSKKNLVEASVIVALVRTLRKACLEVNTGSLTVGIITPYSSQKDHLKQCFLKQRTEPLIVDVNSVDGFQGQERDIIIISTVRANKRGVIGFLKDYRRLNVAITRARYCLWIVGCSKTLSAKQNIWALRLKDVNQRGLFKRVNDGELANAVIKAKRDLGEYIDLLQMGSAFFSNMLWKVLFSNTFKNAFVKLRSLEKRHKILYKIRRLGLGHHASSHKIKMQELEGLVEVHMVADLCLIWSIDVERDSEVQQIIKVWDVIDYSTLSIYVKRLQNAFNVYSEGYMQRCKTRQLTW